MKKVVLLFLCSFLLSVFISSAYAAGGWKPLKNSNGIKSYERSVPGTKLKEFMAVTVVDAKMEVIGEALRDVPSFPKWITDCSSARVEKKFDRNNMVIYMALEPPVLKQRDLVLRNKTVYDWDNGKATISFSTTDDVKVPPKDGCVRLTKMSGIYDMEYLGRNKTKFVYKLLVDPMVSFPVSIGMAYSVMKNYPYKTLEKLKVLAKERKYADIAKGTEEEKGIDSRARNESSAKLVFVNRLQKYVKDKASFKAAVDSDAQIMRSIMSSGGSYDGNREGATKAYLAYIDKIVQDKNVCMKLKANKSLTADLVDMVESECGVDNRTVESILDKYR